MRFLGNIEAKTDAKGRVFLPASFRKILQAAGEETLVLRKDAFQPCLRLYPMSVWNKELDELRSRLNRWNKAHQNIFRSYVADVESLSLDGNGRFLIPRRFIEMAGITQSVNFIGMDDTIEIWASENTQEPFMSADELAEALEGLEQI